MLLITFPTFKIFFPSIPGTKERALVHALSTAALTYTTARGCATSSINSCGCSSHPDDPPNGNFKWGGCGDNIQWGARFSKQFADIKRKSGDKKKNTKTYRYYNYRRSANKVPYTNDNELPDQSNELQPLINNHNGDIGRKVGRFG